MRIKAVNSLFLYISAAILMPMAVILATTHRSVVYYLLFAVSLLCFVKIVPFARSRENLWMFFLVFVFSIPVNVSIVRTLPIGVLFYDVFRVCLVYVVLITVEEIVMGYITRVLWPRQHKMLYYEEKE